MEEHWKYDDDLTEEQLAARKKRQQKVFTSAIAQRLVMNRLQRLGRYDPDHAMQLAAKGGKGINAPDFRVLQHAANRSVVRHRDIPASLLHDMLTLFGGYRPQNQAVFPMARGKYTRNLWPRVSSRAFSDRSLVLTGEAVVAHIAKQVQADDQFILKPTGLDSHKKSHGSADALTYEHIVDCVNILERWREGKGREEVSTHAVCRCL